jgi:hypothetical protein
MPAEANIKALPPGFSWASWIEDFDLDVDFGRMIGEI